MDVWMAGEMDDSLVDSLVEMKGDSMVDKLDWWWGEMMDLH